MKNVSQSVLSFAIAMSMLLSPLQLLAQSANPYLVPAQEYKVEIDKIVYSLQNLDEVIKDLDVDVSHAALKPMTKNVAADIAMRFGAAVEMIGVVINDPDLNEQTREDYTVRLAESLGVVIMHVLRDRKADWQAADELATKITPVSVLREIIKESAYDARILTVGLLGKSAKGELQVGPVERIRREQLTKQLVLKWQDFAKRGLPEVADDTVVSGKMRGLLRDYEAKMMLKVKKSRAIGQVAVTATFAGLALFSLMPQYDLIGHLEGGRSQYSLFASSAIYFSVWFSLAFAKATTIAFKAAGMIENLISLLNNPNGELSKMGWFGAHKQRIDALNIYKPIEVVVDPSAATAALSRGEGGSCKAALSGH